MNEGEIHLKKTRMLGTGVKRCNCNVQKKRRKFTFLLSPNLYLVAFFGDLRLWEISHPPKKLDSYTHRWVASNLCDILKLWWYFRNWLKRKRLDWKKAGMSCFWQAGLGGWQCRQVHFYRYSASTAGDVKDCPRHNILSLRIKCTLKFWQKLYKIHNFVKWHFETGTLGTCEPPKKVNWWHKTAILTSKFLGSKSLI